MSSTEPLSRKQTSAPMGQVVQTPAQWQNQPHASGDAAQAAAAVNYSRTLPPPVAQGHTTASTWLSSAANSALRHPQYMQPWQQRAQLQTHIPGKALHTATLYGERKRASMKCSSLSLCGNISCSQVRKHAPNLRPTKRSQRPCRGSPQRIRRGSTAP